LDLSPLVAQAAKSVFGNEVIVVFCNNARQDWGAIPECPYYDFIIAPTHLPKLDDLRVIECVGIPHLITKDVIAAGVNEWESRLSHITKSKRVICVLLGGNIEREKYPLTAEQARDFGRRVNQFAMDNDGALLITNSHRTLTEATQAFMQEITEVPAFFHDWKDNAVNGNPYYAFLGLANTIIVTIDSISMMFESAGAQKELYLVQPHAQVETQHTNAAQLLIAEGFARPFNGISQEWERPPFPNWDDVIRNAICAQKSDSHAAVIQVVDSGARKQQPVLGQFTPNTAT